jgi:hypothetical protein
MKQVFIILLNSAIAFSVKAQNIFPSSGNVGIGTVNPTLKLHLNESDPGLSNMIYLFHSGINNSHFFIGTAKNDYPVIAQRNSNILESYTDLHIGAANAGSIYFETGRGGEVAPQRMVLANDGSLGIGNLFPKATLHVAGSGTDKDGGNNHQFSGNMIVEAATGGRTSNTGPQIEFVLPANSDGSNAWGQARIITVAGNAYGYNATGKMILGTRRMFDKLGQGAQWYYGDDIVIDGTGNIGMGTEAPSEKLSVNGNVLAKKVRVSQEWADYVFDSTYVLKPLETVNNFIQTNKHLPGMPSAQEVETKGLDLGEMVKKQQEKIEELTLYLIELKKANDEQKIRYDLLQAKMEKLESVTAVRNK